jgi:phosphatidylglycerol:prolipoprotein diacylglycerol transferase
VCLLLAILSAFFLAVHLAKQKDIAVEKVYSLCFWSVITGIIGARLFFVTEYWQDTLRFDPATDRLLPLESLGNILNFAQGGLVVFGSILGGALGALIFMRRNNMPVLRTFDMMAPAMMLGSAIGRIGCLLNGCCFGGVTDLPWGIVFPPGSPAHVHQIAHGDTFFYGLKFTEVKIKDRKLLAIAEVQPDSEAESNGLKPKMFLWYIAGKHEGEPIVVQPHTCREAAEFLTDLRRSTPDGKVQFNFFTDPPNEISHWLSPGLSEVLPIHPTQIYSSILALLLCGTLLCLGRLPFYRQREGLVFASFMILYSVGRFCIEVIRTDEDSFVHTGLTISQNISIAVCLAGITLFVYACRERTRSRKR